jgi:hypothetical protein
MIVNASVSPHLPVDRLASPLTAQPGSPEFILGPDDIVEYARCPGRFRARGEPVEKERTASHNGLRSLYLTPDRFGREFRQRPETYTVSVLKCPGCGSISPATSCAKCGMRRRPVSEERPWAGNASACRAWHAIAERDRVTPVRAEEFDRINKAVQRLDSLPDAAELRRDNEGPVYLQFGWQCGALDVTVPLLLPIDLAPNPAGKFGQALGAFRVVADAGIAGWASRAFSSGEHLLAALTLDAWNLAQDDERKRFLFLLVESQPPHEPGRRELAPDLLGVGRAAYTRVLNQYCASLDRDIWPGYDFGSAEESHWTPLAIEPWMHVDGRTLFGAPALQAELPVPNDNPETA